MMKNAFFNRYGFRILIVIFFLLPLIGQGTNRTIQSNSNNVADWLPDSFEETHQYQWFLSHFPFERFVIVSWEGCTVQNWQGTVHDNPILEMFAQRLVPGQTIDNIGQWAEELIQADIDVPLDVQLSPPPAAPQTFDELADDEQLPVYTTYFKTALTGPRLFRMLKDLYSGEGLSGIRLEDAEILEKLKGVLIGPDGQSTAILVTLTQEAPQGKELALVLDAIKEIGRECGVHPQIQADDRFVLAKMSGAIIETVGEMIYGRNPSTDGVILGGPPVDNVAITQEGEQTLKRLAGLCGLIGLTLAWFCFRDFRLTMFVFFMALISAGVALASVSFSGVLLSPIGWGSFGTCDAILLSMPALVYVLAMSGAIHMINYYHDAVREQGLDMAPERAVRYAWYPCFCANITTSFGLISLCMSGLIPISKFGFYSALGIMLQLILLFYYLPTLLHFYPSHKVAAQRTLNINKDSTMQVIWRVWSKFIIRNAAVVTVICTILMFVFGLGLTQLQTSVKMMRFFSSDSEIIAHYTWLEDRLGPLVPMEIVVQFDNEQLLDDEGRNRVLTLERLRLIEKISNALQTDLADFVGGVMSAETMTPPPLPAPEGRKPLSYIAYEHTFSRMLDSARPDLRDYITVEGNLSLLPGRDRMQNLEQLDITADEADRLIAAGIDDVKKLVSVANDMEFAGITREELRELRRKAVQWERQHGTDLWRISLRVWSLKKDIDYALFLDHVRDVVEPIITEANSLLLTPDAPITAVYTGMVPVVYKTQHELYRGLVYSFVASFFLIGIAISFILKSPIAGFLAMVPNLFPIFIVFGFMGHYGVLIDIGTMMTASVALGIATDDTIHFLTWFRHGIDQGKTRPEATQYAYSRCASAMTQTTLIAGFGLAAFALSTFTPTQMFGIMMLAILLAATIGNLVFLAAILNTPIGKYFEPVGKR
ncbi:MAG: MMPL family transporter [Planctomycetaceae bacterium]|nr:MMPL family transporter [Planctomycetaceae bacterium]